MIVSVHFIHILTLKQNMGKQLNLNELLMVSVNGSGAKLRTLNYENPGSNPVLRSWASFFHS